MRESESKSKSTLRRYNRIAPVYDAMGVLMEWIYKPWRRRVWSLIKGPKVIEVGVGTGKNLAYYPSNVDMTGVDLSDRMLRRAQRKAISLEENVDLRLMDVEDLEFTPNTFDEAVATFVFCSVPEPISGLKELARVVSPGGRIFLLEHVRARLHLLGRLMDWLDPLISRMMGLHINRDTVENVRQSGLSIEEVEGLDPLGIYQLIIARVNKNT